MSTVNSNLILLTFSLYQDFYFEQHDEKLQATLLSAENTSEDENGLLT